MENKNIVGLIGLVSLLLTGGYFLTPEQLDNAFFCTATEEVGIFYGGISGTGLTAYPYSENRTDFERCKKDGISGTWISLVQYSEESEIDPLSFLKPNQTKQTGTVVEIGYNNKNYQCVFSNKYSNGAIISSQRCEEIN